MTSYLFPTHATEMLAQTLGDATIAAQPIKIAFFNASTFLTTVNTGTKALYLVYDVALTSILFVNVFTAKKYLFTLYV